MPWLKVGDLFATHPLIMSLHADSDCTGCEGMGYITPDVWDVEAVGVKCGCLAYGPGPGRVEVDL